MNLPILEVIYFYAFIVVRFYCEERNAFYNRFKLYRTLYYMLMLRSYPHFAAKYFNHSNICSRHYDLNALLFVYYKNVGLITTG